MNSKTVNGMKCFLFLFGLLGVTVSAHGASFDCGKAATKVEKLICGDAELSKLDEELADTYETALQDEGQAATNRQTQKQWLKVRNACSDAACVKQSYDARLHGLAKILAGAEDRYRRKFKKIMDIEKENYRYKLEISHNDKVCSHMKEIYNQHFKNPFKASNDNADYEEGGQYALPLLPGVKRDPHLAIQARRSLQPTSPEFDAVKWQEGRYRQIYVGQDQGDQEMLVAKIDIDNDGSIETVIKESFMEGYLPSYSSMLGGEDNLSIFHAGELDTGKPIQLNTFYNGQDGHQPPAHLIGASYGFPYRLVRLFTYDDVNYISAYRQVWPKVKNDPYQMPDQEYLDVLKYRSGGDNLGKGKWTPLVIDTICQFSMSVVK